jgi:hypothetical protein
MAMTTFEPKQHGQHGFHFPNSFVNNILIAGISFTTKGRCGGMVYAALDYYNTGTIAPSDTSLPADGTTLADYIWNRQKKSLEDMLPAFVEKTISPFESDHDRFMWGVRPEGQLGVLMQRVNTNRPVPLGLISVHTGFDVHHQVLGIGYDLLGSREQDVRVHIYDPNYPDRVITLIPDPSRNCFQSSYAGGSLTHDLWRTYFVWGSYQCVKPPSGTFSLRLFSQARNLNFSTGVRRVFPSLKSLRSLRSC